MPDAPTPEPSTPPGQSERGKISGPELTRASWQSSLFAAAAGAALVVLQGFESGRYTFSRESFGTAGAAFLIVFLTLSIRSYYSGPVPTPTPSEKK